MENESHRPDGDLVRNLKWLMLLRVVFTTFLLASTIVLHSGEASPSLPVPLIILYALAAGIFLLSLLYATLINRIRRHVLFAYIQTGADTVIVTLVIYVTGGYASVFSFLYLVVIIYTSILLYRPGCTMVAALSSIQYGVMIDLEFYEIIIPYVADGTLPAAYYPWSLVMYKILMNMMAFFAVAFLSGILSERKRLADREIVVLEERVRRAERLAVIGEMAARLAHEIKNPLASLAGSVQLLKEDCQDRPDQGKLMQIVLRETDRLSSLLSNFLLSARPPAGKLEVLRLDRAASEIIELFEKSMDSQERVSISKDLHPDVWIEIDPEHFRQILWNLLLNAAEAIREQGRVRIETYLPTAKRVGIKVTDDGCGMTREMTRSIFDPFFSTKPHGTGLGLSIVHSIAEAYAIEMNVESALDEGTTFTLELARAKPRD